MFPVKIPKVVHLFWDENTPMSFLRLQTLVSLRKLNPDFKIVLHTSKDKTKDPTWDTHEFRNVVYSGGNFYAEALKVVDKVRNWDFESYFGGGLPAIHKADFIRLHVLGSEGGFWSDMDIVWIKPLSEMFSGKLYGCSFVEEIDFATVFKCWSTGAMASVKECSFFKEVFETAKKERSDKEYQSVGPLAFKKSGLPEDVINRFPGIKFMDIDYDVFYPVPWNNVGEIFFNALASLPSNCAAIHWFAGSVEAANFMNNFPTKESLFKVENMLTRELRKLDLL
jgi:hypothetical protein